MYLKRSDGPRAVTLPDGSIMSWADLPPASTQRWVASRKLAVVQGVFCGLITRDEALRRYALSSEEFDQWCRAVARGGKAGLKVTGRSHRRQL